MKKAYALILAMVMLVSLAMPVFGSYGDVTPQQTVTVATEAPAPLTEVSVSGVSGVAATSSAAARVSNFKDVLMKNTQFLADYNIPAAAKVAAVFELNYSGTIPAGGVMIPITVNNASAGDYVIVMHRRADGIWEIVGSGILGANKTIVGTFTSFSPVMVLVVDAADVEATGVRSPKTGQ